MKTLKLIVLNSFLLISVVMLLGWQGGNGYISRDLNSLPQDTSKWVAPDSAGELVNPIAKSEESELAGMTTYKRFCRSCHGKLGNGQGVESEDLSTKTTDFTQASYLEQSDGAMFWKINEGRNDMESFKNELTEEEIWQVVTYIKTFSK